MTEHEARIAWEFLRASLNIRPGDSGFKIRKTAGKVVFDENGIATWSVWSDVHAMEFYDMLAVASFVSNELTLYEEEVNQTQRG